MTFNASSHNSTGQNVVDYLHEVANSQTDTTQISLDFRALTDLLPILDLLASFGGLKKLSLHGNRLKQLPTDLSKLSSLQTLDISNNFLDDNVQMTVLSLQTLPNLKNLIYTVPQQKQQKLLQQLSHLQYLNRVEVQRKQASKQSVFSLLNRKSMGEFQLRIANLYKTLLIFRNKYMDESMQGDAVGRFQHEIRLISNGYLDKLNRSNCQPSSSQQHSMLYMAKYQIFDQLIAKAMTLCQHIYSDFGEFISNLFKEQGGLFKCLAEQQPNLDRVEFDFKERISEQKRPGLDNVECLSLNRNLALQKQIKRLRNQKQDLISEMYQVENQNRKLMDSLTRFAKGDKSVLSNFNGTSTNPNKLTRTQTDNSQNSPTSRGSIPLPNLRSSQKTQQILKPHSNLMRQSQNYTSNYSTGSNRNITLKQLKDTIQQIYESKLKFDQKNYDGKIARQTMHQYLFTYLNQKYGLKNLTIQTAASIVSGIQVYSSEDNDICVFGKILRNEVDQQFRFVQTQLKTTVTDLLKMHVKTKMPYKSATQINQILSDKMNNEIVWQQTQDIVKYLYNKQDAQAILKKLDLLFKTNQKPKDQSRRLTREQQAIIQGQKQVRKLRFSHFLKCILDFQLKNHEKLLRPLVLSFKQKDFNSDGIIDQQQFLSIIQQLCQQANDLIPYLLNIIDPYQTKQVTFTQMVRLVANYPESSPILGRFIGQRDQDQTYLDEEQDY